MRHFIETKVKYEKATESGLTKKVTEPYLVDAMSCTEAEKRVTEEVAPRIQGDFSVSAVRESNISEVFRSDAETDGKWYKVKANFIAINEKTGQEKKTASYMLVQASDFHTALRRFDEGMKGTMADCQIAAVTETAITDVYGYGTKDEGGASADEQP